jgi:hypothetical protein
MCSKAGIREARYGHVLREPCRTMGRSTSSNAQTYHWPIAMILLASSTSRKRTGFTGQLQTAVSYCFHARSLNSCFPEPLVETRCKYVQHYSWCLAFARYSVSPLLIRVPGFPHLRSFAGDPSSSHRKPLTIMCSHALSPMAPRSTLASTEESSRHSWLTQRLPTPQARA